jgi:hypothetical protein
MAFLPTLVKAAPRVSMEEIDQLGRHTSLLFGREFVN